MTSCVRIVSNNIYINDAVGNFCYDLYNVFNKHNVSAQLYAESYDKGSPVKPYIQLSEETQAEDIVFYHHSIEEPHLQKIVQLVGFKLFYFHGVTPPALLKGQPLLARSCEMGLQQLSFIDQFDGILVNSLSSKLQILQATQREDIDAVLVPPMVATRQSFAVLQKNEDKKQRKIKRFLSVGRLVAHKKIEDTITLFKTFVDCYPQLDAELEIIGGGSDEYLLQLTDLAATYNLTNKIKLRGFVAQDELVAAYQRADVLIMMSEHEGYGVPLLESLKVNLPILAYRNCSIGEVLADSGCQFANKDFFAMAAALYKLVDDTDYREQVLRGQHERLKQLLWTCREEVFLNLLRPKILME